jgi:ActR/RegA family two-component response regulator
VSGPARVPKAVICDDDDVTSSVIARLLRQVGFDVVAETDNPAYALSVIEQFAVDEAVVDISLDKGDGEDVIRVVDDQQLACQVVVFSSFIDDPMMLIEMGAAAVVDKPDFDRLGEVLSEHYTDAAAGGRPRVDRRRPLIPREPTEDGEPDDVHGFAASELARRVALLRAGDAVLAFEGDLIIDLRDVAHDVTRPEDIAYRTEDGEVVVLLLDPHVETLGAVHRRITAALKERGGNEPAAVGALCRGDEAPRHTLARVLGELHGAPPGQKYL